MSKLTKLAKQPELFFVDAFKKRKKDIVDQVDKINDVLRVVGVSKNIEVSILEERFVKYSLIAYEKSKLQAYLLSQPEHLKGNRSVFHQVIPVINYIKSSSKPIFKKGSGSEESLSAETMPVSPQILDIAKILKNGK